MEDYLLRRLQVASDAKGGSERGGHYRYPIQRRAKVSLCIEPDPELDSLLPDKDWKVHELGPLAFGKWSSRLRPILEF